MTILPDKEIEQRIKKIDSLHLGRKAAILASVATLVIVPIIMLVSHMTVPDTDPMYKAMTPVVGIVYTPIVFLPAWGIIYIVLKHIAFKKVGL
ncbi:hypothetical protein [Kaarinaea lacus]